MAKTKVVTLYSTATITQTTNGSAVNVKGNSQPIIQNLDDYAGAMEVELTATTTTGTSPTLDFSLQGRWQSTGTWVTLNPSAAWTQITNTTTTVGVQRRRYAGPNPPEVRPVFTIGGTTPTYAVEVSAVLSTDN